MRRLIVTLLVGCVLAPSPTSFARSSRDVVNPYDVTYYPQCNTFLDVHGQRNVLDAYATPHVSYLFVAAAAVQDDGENDRWSMFTGPADIGLHIYGGQRFNEELNDVRLYGPFDRGIDNDGSWKLEWDDYCSVQYNNFAVMRVSGYPWRCVRVMAIEGDDQEWIQGSDDVVYDGIVCLDTLGEVPVQAPHTCNIRDKCAMLWFAVREYSYPGYGHFWH